MIFEETFETLDELEAHIFKEVSITTLTTSQAAMSYHNRLHAMYVDNRQTGKSFSKQWVIDKHKELVAWMNENGWTHPKRGDNLDKTVETFGEAVPFDESGLKEGKPILVLEIGKECSSQDGKERTTVTNEICAEIEKNYNAGHHPGLTDYGSPIDADHELVNLTSKKPVKNPTSVDRVFGYLGAKVKHIKNKGLALVAPLWNDRAKVLETIKKIGISSYFGPYYAKRGKDAGKRVGYTLYNISLLTNPQQGTLSVGPEMLRDIFGEHKTEGIYISEPIDFNEEESKMSEIKTLSEETMTLLGDAPEEKVKSLIALAEEAEGLRKDNEDMKGEIEKLKKRPTNEAFEEVKETVDHLKAEERKREEKERKKILLFGEDGKGGYVTPGQLETEEGKRWLNSDEMPRPRFDEMVSNMTRLDSKVKGVTPKDESEIYSDASDEITKRALKKVEEAKKNGEKLTFEEASTQVAEENPDLIKRYDDETLVK